MVGIAGRALGLDAAGGLESLLSPVLSLIKRTITEAVADAVAQAGIVPAPHVVDVEPAVKHLPRDDDYSPAAMDVDDDDEPGEVVQPAPYVAKSRVSPATAEKIAALDLFVESCVVADPDAPFVTAPELLAHYISWRPTIDGPLANTTQLGEAMSRAGYTNRRQARTTDDRERFGGGKPKPMLYWGVRVVVEAPQQDAPPTEPVTGGAVLQLDDHRPAERGRGTYDGEYPGREMPREFRDLIVPVLKADTGWRYFKSNGNGKGKPRLVAPSGRPITLPNTPSDWRGLKNTAATIKRVMASEAAMAQ